MMSSIKVARNIIHCLFCSFFLSVMSESIKHIMLHFAREAFSEIIISLVLVRGVRERVNGANVPHQHPRLTCAGMSEFLTTSDARFITSLYTYTHRAREHTDGRMDGFICVYTFITFCKKNQFHLCILQIILQCYFMRRIIQFIK